jgi:hypothetical protein
MRYGLSLSPLKVIMVAADDIAEFESLFSEFLNDLPTTGAKRAERATVEELFAEPIYNKFRLPPMVLEFEAGQQIDDFCATYGMVVMDDVKFCVEKQREIAEEARAISKLSEMDNRPLREVLGITSENDIWDTRSDEAKVRDAKADEYYRKAAAGESFGPPKKKKMLEPVDPPGFDPDTGPDTDDRVMAKDGMVKQYRIIEVPGAKLPEVIAVLRAATEDPTRAYKRRNSLAGCWIAVIAKRTAERYNDILTAAGFKSSTYAVDENGKQIKATKKKKTKTEFGPRPWNDGAELCRAMDEETKNANLGTYQAKEFYFVIDDLGLKNGLRITITPAHVFKNTYGLWDQSLEIQHLLPYDFEEESPGIYSCGRIELEYVSGDLHHRGFKENFLFQVYLAEHAFNNGGI